jgi:hypothetical protein
VGREEGIGGGRWGQIAQSFLGPGGELSLLKAMAFSRGVSAERVTFPSHLEVRADRI